eukprot:COSAG02_NODE_1084_length_14692_cov_214.338724_8_plen_128_part_00
MLTSLLSHQRTSSTAWVYSRVPPVEADVGTAVQPVETRPAGAPRAHDDTRVARVRTCIPPHTHVPPVRRELNLNLGTADQIDHMKNHVGLKLLGFLRPTELACMHIETAVVSGICDLRMFDFFILCT